jgi:putative membrane protein
MRDLASPPPYCGAPPTPGSLWSAWNLDPPLLLALLALAGLWALARGQERGRPILPSLGWLTLVVAFVSPLCALSSALFSARVTHHMLLVAVAAPLLVAGRGGRVHALPGPGTAALIKAVVLWLWHAPAPYAAALASPVVYWVMELSLLGAAALFWASVLDGRRQGAAVLALLATMAHMGLLGAILTFAPEPLYAWHEVTTWPFGLSPREDQQLAGLIMWVPAGLVYATVAVVRLAGWLDAGQRGDQSA